MRLSGRQYQKLQEALVQAFPRHADLAQMVRTGLDVNLDHVAGGGNLQDVAFYLIQWAESRGRLDHLLWAAQSSAPRNLALQALAQELGAAPPEEHQNPLTAPRPTSSNTTSTPQERLHLMQTLSGVVPPVFAQILFIVSPPPGLIGGPTTPQAERAIALLEWAEGPGGCGIDAVRKVVGDVLRQSSAQQVPKTEGPPASGSSAPPTNAGGGSDSQTGGVARMTVLELDLVGYSDVVRVLQQNVGPEAVTLLNRQVQDFVDAGLKAIGVRQEDAVASTTGDGAILTLERPDQAHLFADAVHGATRAFNNERGPAAQRWFRMGACSGEIDRRPRPGGGFSIAGEPIGNAVRLETAARPGELVVDVETWRALPLYIQERYGPEEVVAGKRDETFKVRRCSMISPPQSPPQPPSAAPEAHPPNASGDRRRIDTLMRRLDPMHLDRLMFLMNMALDRQPSPQSPPTVRKDEIVRWASASLERMRELEATLEYLIEKEQDT